MSLDHSDFVARHTPGQKDPHSGAVRARRILISLAIVILYMAGCVALGIVLKIDETTMLAAGLAFVLAAVMAFLFQRFLHTYSSQEKERLLLRQVIEGSRSARLITDGADNTVFTNQKFDELSEGEEAGAAGLDTLAGLFSDNPEAHNHFRNLADQAQKGLSDQIELKSVQKHRERWFIVSAQPVAGWAGYVHWRLDDVTLQREFDRTIREEREKLIDFTDNAPVGFFSVDESGRFVFVNATLARWVGEDIQSLLQTGNLHAFLENPPQGAPYDITDKGGMRQVAEIVMKGVGGRTFLASVNQTVGFEEDGRVRTRGVIHDLTAEREMRQALQASEDRFERFFEEAPLGIALVNEEGIVQDCNVELASMLGLAVQDVEGKNFKVFLSEHEDQALGELARIRQGEQSSRALEIVLKGSKEVSAQMHARKIKGSEGIVLHFLNLTEQKRLEAQFVQSQKMQAIGQLAGGIAHDFNNLLTAIIGFCDLLMLRHKPGDPSFADIQQIKQNSNRAANLVRQLLAFSRQQTLRPQVQDVTDILTEVSHLLRRLIGANIELDLHHGVDLGLVKVDVGQMDQVLMNLAVNARDAMEGGGKLSIATQNYSNTAPVKCCDDMMPPGQWVRIDVTDTGTGISPENLSRILEPFFTTKDVGHGTGLGLATVYGIIRQTGGYLAIDSTVGAGTTFTIYLPRLGAEEAKQQAEARKVEDEPAKDLTGSARILLVEDEDAVRTFSTRALTNKGYQVFGAENGEAGLAMLEKESAGGIDLLITDVMMPGMDGPTMAKKIREKSPNLKIIFISGYTEDKLKDHMGENIYFLPKPFTLKQLAEKVKEALQ